MKEVDMSNSICIPLEVFTVGSLELEDINARYVININLEQFLKLLPYCGYDYENAYAMGSDQMALIAVPPEIIENSSIKEENIGQVYYYKCEAPYPIIYEFTPCIPPSDPDTRSSENSFRIFIQDDTYYFNTSSRKFKKCKSIHQLEKFITAICKKFPDGKIHLHNIITKRNISLHGLPSNFLFIPEYRMGYTEYPYKNAPDTIFNEAVEQVVRRGMSKNLKLSSLIPDVISYVKRKYGTQEYLFVYESYGSEKWFERGFGVKQLSREETTIIRPFISMEMFDPLTPPVISRIKTLDRNFSSKTEHGWLGKALNIYEEDFKQDIIEPEGAKK